ncbi:MAG: hypothetical protein MUE61_16555 [Vicinamibacterales bacterium]|jgi:hypothetical protein|nr:hypothetical protein [Vicinamibacterales bacterium]
MRAAAGWIVAMVMALAAASGAGTAFAGGVDVRIGSGRVAVVPGFRVRAVTRGEDLVGYYPGGFPRWTIGAGGGVRVGF